MPASNTRECFSEFVGQKVIGVLFDAHIGAIGGEPRRSSSRTAGSPSRTTGRSGSTPAEDVGAAVRRVAKELNVTAAKLRDVLALAGAPVLASEVA